MGSGYIFSDASPYPGLFSALGLLVADLKRIYRETKLMPVGDSVADDVRSAFARIRKQAEAEFAEFDGTPEDIAFEYELEMRFKGQGYELLSDVDLDRLEREGKEYVLGLFKSTHETRYGAVSAMGEVEIVTFRLTALAATESEVMSSLTRPIDPTTDPQPADTGEITFGGAPVSCSYYWRGDLVPGTEITGAAVIEEPTATTLVPPGWTATVDRTGARIPPNEVMSDIYAQFSANRTGEARFIEMLERFGEETVLAGAAELQDYSERLAREAISAIPDGTYEAENFVDDNGFTPDPLRVAVKIKVDGDSLEVDFEGSAPQTKGIITSPLAATVSAAFGAIGILLGGGRIPVNDGLYRPIRSINVPYGSFLNPSEPRAVRARNNACHRVYNSIMLAMSDVVPTQVLASGHDTTNAIGMGHMSPEGYRVYMEVVGGGWGASAGAEGADVVDGYVGNCSNVPVESLETDYPFMRVEEYALRRGSAGAGERRGGLGARRVYRILADGVTFNSYSDRFKVAPWGLFDGKNGQHSQFTVERDGEFISLPSKGNTELLKGDRLIIETAGGGGFGDPRKRDRDVLEREIAHGLLTAEDAAEIYGLS